MKKMMMITLVAALSMGVLAGCGGGDKADREITVTLGEGGMKFDAATYSFKKGETVKVNLVNKDAAQAHSFVIPGLNVKSKQVPAGKTDSVTVKADKEGTYDLICDVPGHKEGGMSAKVEVK